MHVGHLHPEVGVSAALGDPLPDVVEEARRVLDLSRTHEVELYLLGGVAIEIRRGDREPLLSREFKDIDFITPKGNSGPVSALLERAGYRPDFEFNAMNGRRRLLFWDDAHLRQVDVFVGEFEMCHQLPLAEHLAPGAQTISLADLLATKLQIYELNSKDQIDILNLLYDHGVVAGDIARDDSISAARLADLCARDWSLWRTVKLNVDRTRQALADGAAPADAATVIGARLHELWAAIESEPKPMKWRLRDRVGDRVQWYDLPEEVR
jgi:hypothetical protein